MSNSPSSENNGLANLMEWVRGPWMESNKWQQDVQEEGTRKALGLPAKGMNITQGIGWKELAVIAAMVIGGVFGTAQLMKPDAAPPPAAEITQEVKPIKFRILVTPDGATPVEVKDANGTAVEEK